MSGLLFLLLIAAQPSTWLKATRMVTLQVGRWFSGLNVLVTKPKGLQSDPWDPLSRREKTDPVMLSFDPMYMPWYMRM